MFQDIKNIKEMWARGTLITGFRSPEQQSLGWFGYLHIVLWIIALVLILCVTWQVHDGKLDPENSNGTISNSSYLVAPSETTKLMSILSTVSLGVAFIMTALLSLANFEELAKTLEELARPDAGGDLR